ncbi:uncharacterized protein LOC127931847 [Oncorhynchus keta]|uniref:uncharacterized protein LOC127931847 n=1 Tax=Oncorhynchus keta TaxID=8018 RepID=UPI00227A9FFF|nr:uncharacterized protein LOC127931847 [Oncorhynchus keta]
MGYLLGVPPTSIPGLCPSPEDPGTSSTTDPSAFNSDPIQPPWTEELRLIRERLSEPGLGLNPQPPDHTQPASRPHPTSLQTIPNQPPDHTQPASKPHPTSLQTTPNQPPDHTQPASRPHPTSLQTKGHTHTGQREERPAQSMAPSLRKNTKM